MKKEVDLHASGIKVDLDTKVIQMSKEAKEYINKSVQEEITKVSDNLRSMSEVFPVMEHEFYKIRSMSVKTDKSPMNDIYNKIRNITLDFCGGETSHPALMSIYAYIINDDNEIIFGEYSLASSRYKNYRNMSRGDYFTISKDLRGTRSLDYIFDICVECKRKNVASIPHEEVREKITKILSESKIEAPFHIIINDKVIWKTDILILQLERDPTMEDNPPQAGRIKFGYRGTTSVEKYFRDNGRIKEDYRNGLLSTKSSQ